jgi:hypothetical protein
MVEGAGFEPAKPVRAAILQTAPINHSGTPPVLPINSYMRQPERGVEPANLPITSRLRCHCATRALFYNILLPNIMKQLDIIEAIDIKSQA